MKRTLAFLCALALMLSLVPGAAFAATQDLQAEIDAGAETIVLEADASDITVTRDTTIDLNGHDLSGVTVLGGTLYLQDSQTADYTVADGVYGHVTGVTGNVKAAEGYLQVGDSFHAVNLDIYAMTLRATDVGVYYKSHFAADEIVAAQVESFGVALSVVTAPNASNLETYCGYSEFTGFEAGEGANSVGTSTLLKGIMKAANGDSKNAKNAAMSVYGRAYIKTADGYFFGETVKRSLQEQVEAIDKVWNKLTDAQKTPVLAMLEGYTSVMENWNIPNIRGIQVPGADADIEIPISVTAENGIVTEAVTVEANGVCVTVPAGTKLAANATGLTVLVTEKETSEAGLTLEESEVLMPMDVHVEGLAADSTAPLTIYLGKVMAENLNMGNYTVYHVENGKANEMVLIPVDAEFTAHNQYKYSLDGELTLYMATFSEVAVVSEDAKWEGEFDYSWYTNAPVDDKGEKIYEIRNADQLAAFGAIVGGMKKVTARDKETGTYTYSEEVIQDSFSGKTIKLLADIDLNDAEENNNSWIFYPIGYWNNEGTYERLPEGQRVDAVSSGLYTFNGTFDGNGHTISNFYHNTWEMKGDHNWYSTVTEQYYRDGMGLFGRVYKGTVKNLTVRNFKSDGEIATTGVIAAYADGATFENIAIFDCNPRVYNIGNGGIVGCVGWYAKEANLKTTFKNITVDNSNKISALWGSYDVPCGGIVGQYYPTSGQSAYDYPINAGIHFDNCHISAQMDVYNDVCANYQYYAYRYAGILLGSVRENVTIDGHSYPKMDGITAKGCTVHFGDWNDYYYCELVANSLASYTHDHQFSRLEKVAEVNGTTITPLKGESFTVPTSGRYNYVVVNGEHATENATCYHFVDGKVHNHDDYNGDGVKDYETVNGESILVENNHHIYLEFNNLVTGYGWGVTTKAVGDLEGVTILDRQEANSVVKFESIAKDSYTTGTTVTIGELFAAKNQNEVAIKPENVQVTVSPDLTNDPDSTVSGVYAADTTDWTKGTLTLTGLGAAIITITDYYFCTPTVIHISVDEVKFVPSEIEGEFDKEDIDAEIRSAGDLFEAVEGAEIKDNDVKVAVTVKVGDTVIEDTVIAPKDGEDWTDISLNLTQAGEHIVTITDGNNCVVAQQTIVVNEKKFAPKPTPTIVQKDEEITLGDIFDTMGNITVDIDSKKVAINNVVASTPKRNRSADLYLEITGGKILYNEENWKESIVIFTTIGEIVVTITDKTYCTPTSVTVRVKTDPDYTIPENLTATYGDKLASVTLPEGFSWKDSTQSVGNAGTNTVTAIYTPADAENYNTVEVNVTITVNKADPKVEIPTGLTATYGETLATVKLPDGFTWKDSSTSVGEVGPNSFPAIYTPTDTKNYNTVDVSIPVTVNPVAAEKFDKKFDGDFLYRVGNQNAVALSSLFKAKDGANIGTVSVTVEPITGATGTYTSNATWTNGTIQFSGTGVVKLTITDNNSCIPTVMFLEVVDAKNVTSAESTVQKNSQGVIIYEGNIVLLNDCSSGFTVSGDYTFYGNGFTLTYTDDGRYLNNGLKQGIVTVSENGTLDNLHIKASIYPTAFMYYGSTLLGDYVQQNSNPREVEGDKTRYYYQLSAVAVSGNATISNCYIYGGRNNIFIDTGSVTVKDTVLECAPVANVQIQSTDEYTVTFENVTTIQHQVNPTVGETSKVMLGAGILVGPDTTSNPTIILNGEFKQYNWVTSDDANAVSDTKITKAIIQGALDATAYNHVINGKTASNLGIIYMNTSGFEIENNTGLPYVEGEVSMKMSGNTVNGQVYSVQNATAEQIYSDYANADRTTVNGDYMPTFDFNLGDQAISYDGSEDTRYLYGDATGVTALYQDGEAALTLDLSKLATIYKYTGLNYTVAAAVCKDSAGKALVATNNVVTLSAQGDYTLEFTVNDNIFYDKNGQTIEKSVERVFVVPLSLTVKEASINNATVNITKTALDGVYNTVNWNDYELQIKFLDCISVTDYDNKGTATNVNLSSNIASATLTPSGVNVFTTASTITITYTDGRVLTVNLSKISGSSPGTKTAKVNTSGSVYFTTEGALNNKPTEAGSQNKCTITSVSFKGNSGSTVTNDTDVTVTWALGSSSSGCFAEGTMITLADGSKKPIEQITYEDELLAWDLNTGAYVVTTPSLIEAHESGVNRVINLNFADETTVRVIVDHGFFDMEENNFVFIDESNVASYVGHEFVKVGENGTYTTTELVSYEITVENIAYYTIQTAIYNNCIAENMFTLTSPPAGVDGWFDYFEIGEGMKYDEEKMQADIEKYGLYTYEDFAEYVTYEQFIAFNGPYLKVLVGRGVLTYEDILNLIATYVN